LGAVSPTVELYFSGPLADLITAGTGPRHSRPIRPIGPPVFTRGSTRRMNRQCCTCGSMAVIIRYAQNSEINFLRRNSFSQVYYVLDDLMSGLESDRSLPEPYRRTLTAFAASRLPAILDLATVLIVPNTVVASGFGNYPIEI